MNVRSTELTENGTHERGSQEVSDYIPMFNPQGLRGAPHCPP